MYTITLPTATSTKETDLVAFKHTSTYNMYITMANDDDIIQFGGYFDGEKGEKSGNSDDVADLTTRANAVIDVLQEFVVAAGLYSKGEFPCYDFPKMYRAVVEAAEFALYIGTDDIEPTLPDSPDDPGRN